MSEYLEFKDEEIPEYNPNPKKDIYCVNGTKNADGMLILGVIIAMAIIFVGIFL